MCIAFQFFQVHSSAIFSHCFGRYFTLMTTCGPEINLTRLSGMRWKGCVIPPQIPGVNGYQNIPWLWNAGWMTQHSCIRNPPPSVPIQCSAMRNTEPFHIFRALPLSSFPLLWQQYWAKRNIERSHIETGIKCYQVLTCICYRTQTRRINIPAHKPISLKKGLDLSMNCHQQICNCDLESLI